MTKKPGVTTIATGYYSRSALNTNFEALNDAFDNTLSLDGSTPNSMQGDLDLNGNEIINGVGKFNTLYLGNDLVGNLSTAFTFLGAWVTGTSYSAYDVVTDSGNTYVALETHTAGSTFSTDLAAGKWSILAAKGASGSGSGDMLASNNLSDVANVATSRSNLGLGASDSPTFNVVNATSFAGNGSALTGIGNSAQTVEVFTSSGTYTKPAGLVAVKVTVVGGGGGGGFLNDTSINVGGGGGGGGGTSIRIIPAATLGATETVTIGAGGTPNAAGGTSSLGTLATATGGGAGGDSTTLFSSTNGNLGGLGGIGASGDINLHGEVGGMGYCIVTSGASAGVSGDGGNSTMGGGALGVFGIGFVAASGNDAVGYGGGGAGKRSRNNSTSHSGGSGFAGIVIVEEMY